MDQTRTIHSVDTGMGAGRIFFQGGDKSGEIWFLSSKLEKQSFFSSNFKIQGGLAPMPPSDAHGHRVYLCRFLSFFKQYKTYCLIPLCQRFTNFFWSRTICCGTCLFTAYHLETEVIGVTFFGSCSCSKKVTPAPAPELRTFTLQLLFPLRKLVGNIFLPHEAK